MDGPYRLINEFPAHDGPVRSLTAYNTSDLIISGCQANSPNIRIWKIDNIGQFDEIGVPLVHDHWVTALTTIKNGLIDSFRDGAIITGCYDSNIRIFSLSGELLLKLSGHTKGVISFSWTNSNQLISGSWDGTARIWDLNLKGLCVAVLSPHENGVNVLGLSNGLIATTSTGESVNNKPANFQLRFWDPITGSQVTTPIRDHDGSIRSISLLPAIDGIVTTSNDGSVKVRTIEGTTITALVHPLQDDGSPPFVLNCKPLFPITELNLVSCGEDGSVVVWSNLSLLQSIPHPSCVWCILPINDDGDFITGDSEGIIRYFSKNPQLTNLDSSIYLTNQLIERVLESRKKRDNGPSDEDLAKAAKWEQSSLHRGTSEGQVMLFNKNNSLIAAQWSMASGTWIEVGQVTGKQNQGQINGVTYDHVLPVEIETASGVQDLQLGYNDGENPFVAAQRFIDMYNLSQSHLQQIADWILQRTGQPSVPTFDLGSSSSSQSNNIPVANLKPSFSQVVKAYVVFDEIPGTFKTKAITKIEEFNVIAANKLNDNDIAILNNLIKVLSETSYYHSSKILDGHIKPLFTILGWEHDKVFPAYDMLRLVALHPVGADLLSSSTIFPTVANYLISINGLSKDSLSVASILTATRFAVNLFRQQSSRFAILSRSDLIVTLLSIGISIHEKSRPIRQALTNLLLNLSIAINQNLSLNLISLLPAYIATIENLLIYELSSQIEILHLIGLSIGTSLSSTSYHQNIKQAILNSQIPQIITRIQNKDLSSIIQQIQKLLE